MVYGFILFFLSIFLYVLLLLLVPVGISIIIYRYFPDFLSIIATFNNCGSNWWLSLKLLQIINISNISQELKIFNSAVSQRV